MPEARMKAFRGVTAYPGYTIGPAHIVSTLADIAAIGGLHMPAIVVAPYLDERQIEMIDSQRIYGIVLDHGSIVDPMHESLSSLPKPSLLGCHGIYTQTAPGDLVAIDGDEGIAVLRPEAKVLSYYRDRKGTRARREPPEVVDVVRRFSDFIRGGRYYRGYRNPLDIPEERGQLVAIARKVVRGEAPTPAEDEYIRKLATPPPAAPPAQAR